jgi:hypothetical protein
MDLLVPLRIGSPTAASTARSNASTSPHPSPASFDDDDVFSQMPRPTDTSSNAAAPRAKTAVALPIIHICIRQCHYCSSIHAISGEQQTNSFPTLPRPPHGLTKTQSQCALSMSATGFMKQKKHITICHSSRDLFASLDIFIDNYNVT